MNRFSSGALLMYQLSPELSSFLGKYFKVFLKPYTVRVSPSQHPRRHPLPDSSLGQGAAS